MIPRCFGVFGDPIAHSRSPAMHGAAFAVLGLPHRYLPFHVAACDLGSAIAGARALGFGGVNLTVPHKRAAVEHCDALSPEAARIGAVNTLAFDSEGGVVRGHNTDGRGFLDALAELGELEIESATILGSGGASLAIVDALLDRLPDLELRWVSRRPGALPRADPRIRPTAWNELHAPRGQLLVNATIVGLRGGPAEFPRSLVLDELDPHARVVDIVYPRPVGGLLDRAAERGLAVQDGLPMLLHQGVRALEIWLQTSLAPDVIEAMRAALLELE